MLNELLLVGIEMNPGPVLKQQPRRPRHAKRLILGLNIGLVNARSAVNKAVELHAVIHDNRLDILIVIETWLQPDMPNAIASDIAPPGFKVIDKPRPDGCRSSGVAVVYADNLKVTAVTNPISPTSFELRTVRLVNTGEHFVITGVYRPPSTSVEVFFDKLADLFDATASSGGHIVQAGDFYCPGSSSETIDDRLSALLSCYNMVTVNNGATHMVGETFSISSSSLMNGVAYHLLPLHQLVSWIILS